MVGVGLGVGRGGSCRRVTNRGNGRKAEPYPSNLLVSRWIVGGRTGRAEQMLAPAGRPPSQPMERLDAGRADFLAHQEDQTVRKRKPWQWRFSFLAQGSSSRFAPVSYTSWH